MKNLKLYSEVSQNIQVHSTEEVVQFAAYDIDQSRLFFASSANFVYALQLSSFQNGRAGSALPVEVCSIDMEPGDFITAFDYLAEKESLLIGTSHGLLLLHNVESDVTELVGNIEGGVKCISPSPTGDLLGLITGLGQLLVMTYDWVLMYERALGEVPEGGYVREAENVSVNCGGISISWRGDGKYFATMGEVYESGCMSKKIKIWESDSGALQSSSETKEFTQGILEWMPSGAKIAAVYKRKSDDSSPSIAFFERNGLERSSFRIGEPEDATESCETLKWNSASDLLAGVVSCKTYDTIRVWFFSNNHWYLKQEIRYPREAGVTVMWDPTKPLQLICWTLSGQVSVRNFMWVTAVMEDSTAFVIDNSKILVTPLSLSLMPPPMYLFSLSFSSAVRDIAYYSRNSKNCLAVFLSDGNLSFVEFPAPNTWEDLEGKDFIVELSDCKTALGSFVHLLWLDAHSLLCVSAYGSSHNKCLSSGAYETELHGSYLQEVEVVCHEDHVPDQVTCSGYKASLTFQTLLESPVLALAWNPSKRDSAFVEFEGGKVLGYASRSGIVETRISDDSVCFPSTCPWVRVAQVDASGVHKPLICGLDDMGRLYINGKNLCNNCSSFSFYSELANEVVTHLIILTKQDFLFIVDTKDVLQGDVALGNVYFVVDGRRRDEENMSYVNIWERGAKVIGVLNGDEAAVILQTVRGNLECIYPRKLVLSSITNALAQQRFKDALNLVRRHRIDFNVIVDLYGWQAFLQSAVEFVEQVNNLNHVTEFVCAMKNEDVTETLYKKFSFSKNGDKVCQVKDRCSNKVSSVLQAIRKALEEHIPESPSRELCILTTLARSDPPAIEESLLRIKSVREMELLNSSDDIRKKSCPSAEEALKHLLWLLDSDAVFEAALGLYDLNLAAIVALNSQRDPKEFLPYLQELEKMPESLMHFKIDIKLQRFDSALRNIVSAGDGYFPDCMNLIKKNPQLFPLGLQLITDPGKKQAVLEAWADHLIDEKRFEDAATTYLCCCKLEKASKAYRECGDWSGVLRVGALMKLGKDEILKLAYELCEEVNALGKPAEAAKIALEYCRDISGGISLLINAREWEEALRVAFLHTADDRISVVKSSALECASGLVSEFKESIEKVGKYLTRYLAVRQRRLLLAAKLKSEERSVVDLDDDTASEASSNLSGMSAYTLGTRRGSAASASSSTATSRARDLRRQRKSGKIRAGSAGEEMALVDHLKGMRMTEGGKRELKSLLICLVTVGEVESAQKLQQTAENFQVSQVAAVELAHDTLSSENVDEEIYCFERYAQKTRSTARDADDFSWMLKVFISP
ncbi:Elongator complex protein 1 [Arabidopsis thaliana x Arabidopsis arenosa]|uniref:Elongator complex protein 1 n=1 Tax=Arabidopsis thaliana x Arabidopsis arenosa TaxID=1240361 RepID=A0A8T1YVI6_9BRAS|nr:Elongator complex protein 1 [Arabidopsis thaliana x Arabidopsis arenosa]